jgi:hypothetical protein
MRRRLEEKEKLKAEKEDLRRKVLVMVNRISKSFM